MSKSYEAIFFDLDGTLVETEGVAVETLDNYFRKAGIKLTADDVSYIVGRKWDLGIRYVLDRYPFSKSAVEVEEEVLIHYRTRLESVLSPVPGAESFVERSAERFRLYCVSGSHRKDIEFALDRLSIATYFSAIVGCEDYPESKPSPQSYLKALEVAGLNADKVLVFEDSEAGLGASLAAGIDTIQIGSIRSGFENHKNYLGRVLNYRDAALSKWF